MAPKKDNIQASLDFISEEIAAIKNEQATIKELVAEVKTMRLENEKKDRQIAYLEYRVAELEQYTRINNVVITGLQVKPRSYARAVTNEVLTWVNVQWGDGNTFAKRVSGSERGMRAMTCNTGKRPS